MSLRYISHGKNILGSVEEGWHHRAGYIANAMVLAFPQSLEWEQSYMLTLRGYFDESGTHTASETVVVAGFLASASDWVEFSGRWQMALNDFGIPFFHMADFANRVPPYDVWTEPVRKTRLARLLSIINKCAATSLATVVHRQEFEDIIPEKAREICGDAYGLAAIVCWMEIREMIREMDVDAWGSYVFEGGARGAGTILKIFQHNVNDPVQKERLRLLSLRFEPKREFLPLQAADILAYEVYKDAARQQGLVLRPRRFPLAELSLTPFKWQFVGKDNLETFAEVLTLRADMEDSGELPPL